LAEDQQRLRWGRIAIITLVGIGFVAAPFYLALRNPAFGDSHVIASGTLTNIGTSILLVGIVFFLERGLVKRVSDAAASSTARVVEERTSELRTANQALATELADLRADFHRAAAAESTEQTLPLRNVATDVSFDSVAEALETANDFGALNGGVIVVPLKAPSDAPELVSFDWRDHELQGPDGRRTEEYAPAISVNYLATRNPGGGPGRPVVEVLWQPDETPTTLLLKLRKEMTRLGFGREAKLVDSDMLKHVGVALSDAVAGRTAEDGAWVEGQMYEWLADGWAVTDAGLISRDHGKITKSDFPKTHGVPHPPKFDPPAPVGVSEEFWKFAVGRAHGSHGHGPSSLAAMYYGSSQNPVPFTTETSPRKRPDWPY
jgi:hypothetical protein